MRRCSWRSVLDRAVSLAGFTVDNLTSTPRAQFNIKLLNRLKDAWEIAWWPELMRSELRYYRDAWTAQAYALGAEVWDAASGKYYTASAAMSALEQPGIGVILDENNVPITDQYGAPIQDGTAGRWTVTTSLSPWISLDQTGKTAIGEVRGTFIDDPMVEYTPRRLQTILGVNGIQVLGDTVPNSAYVWYRIRMPEFRGADYSAAATYTAGMIRYYADATDVNFEGDFWVALATVNPGETPKANPAKWSRYEFPQQLRDAVAHGAYADWLRLDGASDLAMAEDGMAEGKLSREIIKLASQGQILRSRTA